MASDSGHSSVMNRVRMFETETGRAGGYEQDSNKSATRLSKTQRLRVTMNAGAVGPVSRRYYNVKALRQPSSPASKLRSVSDANGNLQQESRSDVEEVARNMNPPPNQDQYVGNQSLKHFPTQDSNWHKADRLDDSNPPRRQASEEGAGWFSPSEESEDISTTESETTTPHPSSKSPVRSQSPFNVRNVPETKAARLRALRYRPVSARPRQTNNSRELKRNLNDASVLIDEEKTSIASGVSSSSSRSSLSQEELGAVAAKALQLLKVSQSLSTATDTVPTGEERDAPTPGMRQDGGIFKETLSPVMETGSDKSSKAFSSTHFHTRFRVTASTASEISSNASSDRRHTDPRTQTLSKRLSRAERYASIKRNPEKTSGRATPQSLDGGGSMASSEASNPHAGGWNPGSGNPKPYNWATRIATAPVAMEIDDSSTITSATQTVRSVELSEQRKSRSDRLAAISSYRNYRRYASISQPAIPSTVQHRSPRAALNQNHEAFSGVQYPISGTQANQKNETENQQLGQPNQSPLSFRKQRAQALRDALVKHDESNQTREKEQKDGTNGSFATSKPAPLEASTSSLGDHKNTMVDNSLTFHDDSKAFAFSVMNDEEAIVDINGEPPLPMKRETRENETKYGTGEGGAQDIHDLLWGSENDQDDKNTNLGVGGNGSTKFLNEVQADDEWGTIAYECTSEDASTIPSLKSNQPSNTVASKIQNQVEVFNHQAKIHSDEDETESVGSTESPSLILKSLEKSEESGGLATLSDVDQSTLHGEGISYSSLEGSTGARSRKSGALEGPTSLLYTASTSMGTGGSSSHRTSSVESRKYFSKVHEEDTDDLTSSTLTGPEKRSTAENKSGSKSLSPRSISSKDDAMKWWNKNYGPDAPENANAAVRIAFSPRAKVDQLQTVAEQRQLFEEDDDEDIFSGLEDGEDNENKAQVANTVLNTEFVPVVEQSRAEKRVPSNERIKSGGKRASDLPQVVSARQDNVLASLRDLQPPPPPPPSQKPKTLRRKENIKKEISEGPQSQTDRAGMDLDASGTESVESEMTSSLISSKSEKRRWFKKRAVHTINEDEAEPNGSPVVAADNEPLKSGEKRTNLTKESNEQSMPLPKEDLLDDNVVVNSMTISKATANKEEPSDFLKEETSDFLNLGYSLFDSVATFCRLETMQKKLPISNPTECVDQTRQQCEKFYNGEASLVNTYQEEGGEVDRSVITSFLMPTGGQVSPTSTYMTMNENDRRLWEELDARDENAVGSTEGDINGAKKKMELQVRRREAQADLLRVVDTAVALYGGIPKGIDPPSDAHEAEVEHTTVQQRNEASGAEGNQASRRSSNLSTPRVAGRDTLGEFSKKLAGEGIEVLKLGRRHKWQTRFLTVTKEVVRVGRNDTKNEVEDVVQCPQGLLWKKRKSECRDRGLNNLKGNGRGGFLFSNLNKVEHVKTEKSSAATSFHKALSKKIKSEFPSFIGLNVEYCFQEPGGASTQRSVVLCFKDQESANAFMKTMSVIKAVVHRQSKLTSGP